MCGIAGVVERDPARPAERSTLSAMAQSLAHRGPDGEGFLVEGPVGLAHRRLAIIDLDSGAQPMESTAGDEVIVFNGEIYNYLEVRAELAARGARFRTRSDTEVILEAYRAYGEACVEKLNGMFAFALWDRRRRALFLARDRAGEKPLFYAEHGGRFLFASEPKALFAAGVPRRPDPSLLDVYLSLGYLPAPYCFFAGVHKLPPAHTLRLEGGRVETRRYWRLPLAEPGEERRDEGRVLEEFEALFDDAVRLRMRSDVPVGAFLSGGLDSSSVVASMVQATREPVHTFTIGFADPAYDERAPAALVAERFHTAHHERVVGPAEAAELVGRIARAYDEPFGDSSALPTFIVSQVARERLKVVLSGDGGDEVLSGYTIHLGEHLSQLYRRLPSLLRPRRLAQRSARWPLGQLGVPGRRAGRVLRAVRLAEAGFLERLEEKQTGLGPAARQALLQGTAGVRPVREYLAEALAPVAGRDPETQLNAWLLGVSLPDDMLCKVDRASMAVSLEVRVPFLDHRLIELLLPVAMSVKLARLTRKHVLRATVGRRLPPALLRRGKQGFGVPLERWLSAAQLGELRALAERTVEAGWVRGPAAAALFARAPEREAGLGLWLLAMLGAAL